MTPWIYDTSPMPVARWGLANGEYSVLLDMPDGSSGDYGDPGGVPGSEDWDGETAIFQGSKALAVEWLRAALASVEALPDAP